jgi:hypothetical protein
MKYAIGRHITIYNMYYVIKEFLTYRFNIFILVIAQV